MNEQELDTVLQKLAAKRVTAPDLRDAVRRKIARKLRLATGVTWLPTLPHVAVLLPASILAAVLVGVFMRFTTPTNEQNNRQQEAAHALHLDIFTAEAMPQTVMNLSPRKH